MKTVYEFDNDRKLISRKVVADDYTLNDHEVTVKPSDDEYPPYLINPDKTAWSGLTLEQYKQVNHLDEKIGGVKVAIPKVPHSYYSDDRKVICDMYRKYEPATAYVVYFDNGAILLSGNGNIAKNCVDNEMMPIIRGERGHDYYTAGKDNSGWAWASDWTVLNPVHDASIWDWSDAYLTPNGRKQKAGGETNQLRNFYEIGIFDDYDIQTYYGAVKKK